MLLGGFMSALAIVLAGLGLDGIGKSNSALESVYENRTVRVEKIEVAASSLSGQAQDWVQTVALFTLTASQSQRISTHINPIVWDLI